MRYLLALLLSLPVFSGGIPKDKLQHFASGMVIGAAVNVGFRWSGGGRNQSMKIGIGVGTMEGIRKEFQDRQSNMDFLAVGLKPIHSVDKYDALATIAGAAVGSLIVFHVYK